MSDDLVPECIERLYKEQAEINTKESKLDFFLSTQGEAYKEYDPEGYELMVEQG